MAIVVTTQSIPTGTLIGFSQGDEIIEKFYAHGELSPIPEHGTDMEIPKTRDEIEADALATTTPKAATPLATPAKSTEGTETKPSKEAGKA